MRGTYLNKGLIAVCLVSLIALSSPGARQASADVRLSKGQTLYVPAYSYVYLGDRQLPFNVALTLIVRNTDPVNEIVLMQANYFDANGKPVKQLVSEPVRLRPLASTSFFLKESETVGGHSPSFIVKWSSEREVNPPLVESLVIGGRKGQGISFISVGHEIKETTK